MTIAYLKEKTSCSKHTNISIEVTVSYYINLLMSEEG